MVSTKVLQILANLAHWIIKFCLPELALNVSQESFKVSVSSSSNINSIP
jgi:hypothetical protein